MDLGIEGKVALVGGSSRGLGHAIAKTLAEEGARVVICGRTPASLEEVRASIVESTGQEVLAVCSDLSTPEGVAALLEAARNQFGPVDILVTNTGGPPAGGFDAQNLEAWRSAYSSLLESVVLLIQGVLPGMREHGWGRIVNVTSIAVKQPVDGLILSNTYRAGVTGLARTLANELASQGITVNNVMPGYTLTERLDELADKLGGDAPGGRAGVFDRWQQEIPAGRLGDPSELAALTAFLCSERAAYITGTSVPVDGGWIRALL
jgi:3-oxoacyl-[acyl-carrier protein] reductase